MIFHCTTNTGYCNKVIGLQLTFLRFCSLVTGRWLFISCVQHSYIFFIGDCGSNKRTLHRTLERGKKNIGKIMDSRLLDCDITDRCFSFMFCILCLQHRTRHSLTLKEDNVGRSTLLHVYSLWDAVSPRCSWMMRPMGGGREGCSCHSDSTNCYWLSGSYPCSWLAGRDKQGYSFYWWS